MFLKRIELQGLKSFADKSIITFDSDVIGIVGPNGCGKSNINDAIRWVLGEQSVKSLRGNSMSDVIFNGSAQRKPVNMAEVTLVFDNSRHLLNVDFEDAGLAEDVGADVKTGFSVGFEMSAAVDDVDATEVIAVVLGFSLSGKVCEEVSVTVVAGVV